jgi:hypothetical protein
MVNRIPWNSRTSVDSDSTPRTLPSGNSSIGKPGLRARLTTLLKNLVPENTSLLPEDVYGPSSISKDYAEGPLPAQQRVRSGAPSQNSYAPPPRTAALQKQTIGSHSRYTLDGVNLFGNYLRADGNKPHAPRDKRSAGSGAQASVYWRNNPNSPVLVKKIKGKFEQSADTLDRMALLLTRTPRGNMARHFAIEVLHHKSKDGGPAVLSRKVEGPTLYSYMRRDDTSSADFKVGMQTRVAALRDAVAWLNEQGFEHRDINERNIIVEQDTGRLVLIDFGMATDKGSGKAQDSFERLDEFLAIHGISASKPNLE